MIKKKVFSKLFIIDLWIFFFNGQTFLDIRFALSEDGYKREPHLDRETRIISFLLYFNTLTEEDGGTLEIFKYNNDENNHNLDINDPEHSKNRKLDTNKLELYKKINPKKNQLVVFLSTPKSVHGVSEQRSNPKKRFFSFGSYTGTKSISWKFWNLRNWLNK